MIIVCERDETAFIFVLDTALLASPIDITVIISSEDATDVYTTFST